MVIEYIDNKIYTINNVLISGQNLSVYLKTLFEPLISKPHFIVRLPTTDS